MATRILTEGPTTLPGHCSGCGCNFTYERSDLYGNPDCQFVTCPSCGKKCVHLGECGTIHPQRFLPAADPRQQN